MTDVSRRSLIGAGAAGVALGTAGISVPVGTVLAAPAQAAPSYTTAEQLYTRPRFKALQGKYLGLSGGAFKGLPFRIVAVDDLDGADAGSETAFRLRFTTKTPGPKQGTYTLRRKDWTTTSLFIVPTDDTRRAYTAVVNSGS
ncbi:DUF6916 family protein [Nocardioides stalactiti]|uniref:DUF6916 family protein n=1 Tax=Nocardioides stalactiti TaxID=2755356 RepID=UPI0016013C96|nr:hypothetical protein [Nocardioides stalactiti]